jgi:hypothetical protein
LPALLSCATMSGASAAFDIDGVAAIQRDRRAGVDNRPDLAQDPRSGATAIG